MLSQETSGHYISIFVMMMIVLLGEALLHCIAKSHCEYGGIKVKVCVCVCGGGGGESPLTEPSKRVPHGTLYFW